MPPNVAAAVAKSLEKLPADRFESAEEFAKALDDKGFSYTAAHRPPSTGIAAPVAAPAAARREDINAAIEGVLSPDPV